ncbi:hypothetical protein ACN28S_15765 [Cystobacter fuscus]
MQNEPNETSRRLSSIHGLFLQAAVSLWLGVVAGGCLPAEEGSEPRERSVQAWAVGTINGLSLNGLSLNGLSLNGLSLNGLSLNGLSTSQFDLWFQTNPTLNDSVMRYVVLCAVPAGETRTYTSSSTGSTWSWTGVLGLAPGWAQGAPATLTEQRLVSACLAAHSNKFGVRIPLSVQGRGGAGSSIPTDPSELEEYPEREGCFFGNLFNDEGIYAGNNRKPLNHKESTPRACALSIKKSGPPDCPPLVRVDPDCAEICTQSAASGIYTSCTYNGITYPAITTRLRKQDIYTCGDGVCQVSEKCGTGNDYDNCASDCGRCP